MGRGEVDRVIEIREKIEMKMDEDRDVDICHRC